MRDIVLPKIISIGIYDASIALKNKAVSRNRRTTMYEIELPIEDGGISYIDSSSRHIRSSTVICAKPGQMRHTRLPFKCYYIHLISEDGYVSELLSHLPDFIELKEPEEMAKTFTSLCEHFESGAPESELILQSLVLKMVHLLNEASESSKQICTRKSSNADAIENTLSYIRENPATKLTLELLSARVNFSPIYFHKLFKTSTGMTLRQYVEAERIKKSIELLTSTNLTLTEIAYECGFSSQSYYSYAFKKKMKLTPREYAKKLFLRYEK